MTSTAACNDTAVIQTSNGTGVLSDLTLRVVGGGGGDNDSVDGGAEVGLAT